MERLISFESKALLEADLAQRIAAILRQEITKKGSATLLLSGGSTPKNLYQKLGELDLDWSKVHVGLVDERFVPQDSPYSNETLIRESLMSGMASNAHFHSMVIDPLNYEENLQLAISENEIFRTSDVIILGMGDDGHTASLFPNDERSIEASISSELMFNTNAPNEPSKRITFCGPILQNGTHVFLMITGEKKRFVLTESAEKNYPIQQFIPFIEGIFFTENA
ncbi:MAG: 6-phosphogluconolactonase [Bacteroidota bacterium]|jgi:6-phosphogluconolactonase